MWVGEGQRPFRSTAPSANGGRLPGQLVRGAPTLFWSPSNNHESVFISLGGGARGGESSAHGTVSVRDVIDV